VGEEHALDDLALGEPGRQRVERGLAKVREGTPALLNVTTQNRG